MDVTANPHWQYGDADGPKPFGEDATYRMGLPWLDEVCSPIEDWGAGLAWGRQFVKRGTYKAIDSAPSAAPFVDYIHDLQTLESRPGGIFMRHVLEHNPDWEIILDNAVRSFRDRMVLVIFTPFADATYPMAPSFPNVQRPILDLSFRRRDLTARFDNFIVAEGHVPSDTQYRGEWLFFLSKERGPARDKARTSARLRAWGGKDE